MSNTFFIAKVRYTKECHDGTLRRVTEEYVMDTSSFTDAEAKIYEQVGSFIKGEFIVKSIVKSDIVELVNLAEREEMDFFKVKVKYQMEDADTGKAKTQTYTYLVKSKNAKQSIIKLEEFLSSMMATYEITNVAKTNVVDVFLSVEENQ